MFSRKCPTCQSNILYSTKYTYKAAVLNNSACKVCVGSSTFKKMHAQMQAGEREYGFSNKSHTNKSKKQLSESIKLAYTEGRLNVSGKNNGMYGKHIPSEKFGKTLDELYGTPKANKIRAKLSISHSGERNSMYGKPSPQGSGNGWSGWYNKIYFRSLLELSFMLFLDEFKFSWESAEKIRIQYLDYSGKNRTYCPDFIINDELIIEIKPSKLFKAKSVELKKHAAEIFCKKNNLRYRLFCPTAIVTKNQLIKLVEENRVKLLERYLKKLNEC